MKILVITQKLDNSDNILGFFSGWLNKLAKKVDKIYVVTLEKRNADLVKNIEWFSLGKENGSNRFNRFLKFNRVLMNLCLNKKIDIIFIHMCPEYAILIWPYAKLKRIPIVMWYAHGDVNISLRIAHLLVNRVISSSRDGFRINSKKLRIIGQGIDTEKFKIQDSYLANREAKFKINDNGKEVILSVGRISPRKNYETLIRAANILINYKNIRDLEFQIVGGIPTKSQKGYLVFLKSIISEYRLEDYVQILGPVPYTQIQNYYQNCNLFVSTSNTGSLDKAVLEAMACGKIIVTCNEAFRDFLKIYSHILMFDKNDIDSLAGKIIYTLKMEEYKKAIINNYLRQIVIENHNVDILINRLVNIFSQIGNESSKSS